MKTFFAAAMAACAIAEEIFITGLEPTVPIPDINSLTVIQYNEMLAGVVYGIIDKNSEMAIEMCLMEGEDEAIAVYQTFEDFRAGDFVKGTMAMKSVVAGVSTMKTNCSAGELAPDVASLEAWGMFFAQPTADAEAAIKHNALVHSLGLTKDLKVAENDWNAGEFFQFGAEIGTMLVICTQ